MTKLEKCYTLALGFCLLLFSTPSYGQSAGDIAIIGMNTGPNSGAHTDDFTIVTLADLPGATTIYLTDYPVNSDGTKIDLSVSYAALEGIINWTTPTGGISAGTVVTFSLTAGGNAVSTSPSTGIGTVVIDGSNAWTSTSQTGSPFNNAVGDNLIIYTGSASSPNYIYAFLNSGTASGDGNTSNFHAYGDVNSPQETGIPSGVLLSNNSNAATALAFNGALHEDNMVYTGATSGSKDDLLKAIGNRSSWSKNATVEFDLSPGGTNFSGSNPIFTLSGTAPASATVAATVFLEGAFNGTGLNTTINSSIPSVQPYNGSTFNNHSGTESATVPVGAVDWVLVELREAGSAAAALNSTKVGSAAGFLMSDGSIKATDGTSDLTVSLTGNTGADFFVVVYHRNHLPIMSASALPESSGTYSIDFTSNSANTHQTTTALASLSGGKFGMPAGDIDGDGDIDATDLSTWRTNNGASFNYGSNGAADFNLDGVINAVDRNDFHQKNTSKTRQVPSS